MDNVKKADAQLRAATIVSSLVLIGLVIYGIRTKRKIGYYLLSIFILAPAAAWLTASVSGPFIMNAEQPAETETDTKKE